MMNRFFGLIERITERVLGNDSAMNFSEQKVKVVIEFVKFGIIGLSNTIISYAVYVISMRVFQSIGVFSRGDYLVAQFIGFILSVLWSFYWNNRFVFKESNKKRNALHSLFKTYISYAFTGLFLNSVLSIVWVEVLLLPKIIAPLINLLVSVPLNFVLNKLWAFR